VYRLLTMGTAVEDPSSESRIALAFGEVFCLMDLKPEVLNGRGLEYSLN